MNNSNALDKFKVFERFENEKYVIHRMKRKYLLSGEPNIAIFTQVAVIDDEYFVISHEKNRFVFYSDRFIVYYYPASGKIIVDSIYFTPAEASRRLRSIIKYFFGRYGIVECGTMYCEVATSETRDKLLRLDKLSELGIIEYYGEIIENGVKKQAYLFDDPLIGRVVIVVYKGKKYDRYKIEARFMHKDKRFNICNRIISDVRVVVNELKRVLQVLLYANIEWFVYRYLFSNIKSSARIRAFINEIFVNSGFITFELARNYSEEVKILRELGILIKTTGGYIIVRTHTSTRILRLLNSIVPLVVSFPAESTLMRKPKSLLEAYIAYKVLSNISNNMHKKSAIERLLSKFKTIYTAYCNFKERIKRKISITLYKLKSLFSKLGIIDDKTDTMKEHTEAIGKAKKAEKKAKSEAGEGVRRTSPVIVYYKEDKYFKRVSVVNEGKCDTNIYPREFSWDVVEELEELDKRVKITSRGGERVTIVHISDIRIDVWSDEVWSAILYLYLLLKSSDDIDIIKKWMKDKFLKKLNSVSRTEFWKKVLGGERK